MISLNAGTRIIAGIALLPFAAWYDLYSCLYDSSEKESLTETLINNIKGNLA